MHERCCGPDPDATLVKGGAGELDEQLKHSSKLPKCCVVGDLAAPAWLAVRCWNPVRSQPRHDFGQYGLEPQRDWSFTMIKRFTLYGSPHSLPTYKVALMLRLSGEPFSFRYVSFQKGMHKTPEFLALSRWGQVPVLVDNERVHLQSAAIVEHLAETLHQFQGSDSATRQAVREWLYWDVDVLFPPIFNCYGVHLGQRKLLPISVEPTIADYHRRRAEAALSVLDLQLTDRDYLCAAEPHDC